VLTWVSFDTPICSFTKLRRKCYWALTCVSFNTLICCFTKLQRKCYWVLMCISFNTPICCLVQTIYTRCLVQHWLIWSAKMLIFLFLSKYEIVMCFFLFLFFFKKIYIGTSINISKLENKIVYYVVIKCEDQKWK
jgi:hypothetical protein